MSKVKNIRLIKGLAMFMTSPERRELVNAILRAPEVKGSVPDLDVLISAEHGDEVQADIASSATRMALIAATLPETKRVMQRMLDNTPSPQVAGDILRDDVSQFGELMEDGLSDVAFAALAGEIERSLVSDLLTVNRHGSLEQTLPISISDPAGTSTLGVDVYGAPNTPVKLAVPNESKTTGPAQVALINASGTSSEKTLIRKTLETFQNDVDAGREVPTLARLRSRLTQAGVKKLPTDLLLSPLVIAMESVVKSRAPQAPMSVVMKPIVTTPKSSQPVVVRPTGLIPSGGAVNPQKIIANEDINNQLASQISALSKSMASAIQTATSSTLKAEQLKKDAIRLSTALSALKMDDDMASRLVDQPLDFSSQDTFEISLIPYASTAAKSTLKSWFAEVRGRLTGDISAEEGDFMIGDAHTDIAGGLPAVGGSTTTPPPATKATAPPTAAPTTPQVMVPSNPLPPVDNTPFVIPAESAGKDYASSFIDSGQPLIEAAMMSGSPQVIGEIFDDQIGDPTYDDLNFQGGDVESPIAFPETEMHGNFLSSSIEGGIDAIKDTFGGMSQRSKNALILAGSGLAAWKLAPLAGSLFRRTNVDVNVGEDGKGAGKEDPSAAQPMSLSTVLDSKGQVGSGAGVQLLIPADTPLVWYNFAQLMKEKAKADKFSLVPLTSGDVIEASYELLGGTCHNDMAGDTSEELALAIPVDSDGVLMGEMLSSEGYQMEGGAFGNILKGIAKKVLPAVAGFIPGVGPIASKLVKGIMNVALPDKKPSDGADQPAAQQSAPSQAQSYGVSSPDPLALSNAIDKAIRDHVALMHNQGAVPAPQMTMSVPGIMPYQAASGSMGFYPRSFGPGPIAHSYSRFDPWAPYPTGDIHDEDEFLTSSKLIGDTFLSTLTARPATDMMFPVLSAVTGSSANSSALHTRMLKAQAVWKGIEKEAERRLAKGEDETAVDDYKEKMFSWKVRGELKGTRMYTLNSWTLKRLLENWTIGDLANNVISLFTFFKPTDIIPGLEDRLNKAVAERVDLNDRVTKMTAAQNPSPADSPDSKAKAIESLTVAEIDAIYNKAHGTTPSASPDPLTVAELRRIVDGAALTTALAKVDNNPSLIGDATGSADLDELVMRTLHEVSITGDVDYDVFGSPAAFARVGMLAIKRMPITAKFGTLFAKNVSARSGSAIAGAAVSTGSKASNRVATSFLKGALKKVNSALIDRGVLSKVATKAMIGGGLLTSLWAYGKLRRDNDPAAISKMEELESILGSPEDAANFVQLLEKYEASGIDSLTTEEQSELFAYQMRIEGSPVAIARSQGEVDASSGGLSQDSDESWKKVLGFLTAAGLGSVATAVAMKRFGSSASSSSESEPNGLVIPVSVQ